MSEMEGVAQDGSPIALYARLEPMGEPELIHAAVPAGCEILELGAGAGRITNRLLALGHRVVAVDQSPEMLRLIEGAETVLGDIETPRASPAIGRRAGTGSSRAECADGFVVSTRTAPFVSGEMEYVVDGRALVHAFRSQLLTDEELDADLRAVGPRRRRFLDERGSWIEAVSTTT